MLPYTVVSPASIVRGDPWDARAPLVDPSGSAIVPGSLGDVWSCALEGRTPDGIEVDVAPVVTTDANFVYLHLDGDDTATLPDKVAGYVRCWFATAGASASARTLFRFTLAAYGE